MAAILEPLVSSGLSLALPSGPGDSGATRLLYTLLVALVAVERGVELVVARRHERSLAARGGRPVGDGHYPVMVLLHSTFLVACVLEPWVADRPFIPLVAGAMLVLLAATMALRWWTIATLGDRWTTRIWIVPGEERITGGPFRWLRHPNYLAVALELFALPLVHTAWLTAVVFGTWNLLLLAHRIRVEERALAGAVGR